MYNSNKYLLEYILAQPYDSQSTFRRNILPCIFRAAVVFLLVPCLAYCSALMIDVIFVPKTSMDFRRTTLRHIPQNRLLHSHSSDILKCDLCNVPLALCNSSSGCQHGYEPADTTEKCFSFL
jgi:hypothetical protein